MGSKIGIILSLPFMFLAFLFGTDLIMVQLTYTSLDSISTVVSYRIGKTGELSGEIDRYVRNEIQARLMPVDATYSYIEGSVLPYYLEKEYKPIVLSNETLTIRIKRFAVVNMK